MRAPVGMALLLVSVTAAFVSSAAAPAKSSTIRKFVISALRSQWRDTGLLIKDGASASIHISSSDATCHTPSASDCPVGKSAGYTCSDNPVVGNVPPGPAGDAIPYGVLAGKVGANGKPFAVPSGATASGPGELYLVYNDCSAPAGYGDNGGSVSVYVTGDFKVKPPPPSPPPTPKAKDGGPTLATVAEIKSTLPGGTPRAFIQRGSKGAFQPLGLGTEVQKGDVIRTYANTVIALDLSLGGRVGINSGSKVELAGERNIVNTEKGDRLQLTSGDMWAKCGKSKEPIEIQTNGGIIGIRG